MFLEICYQLRTKNQETTYKPGITNLQRKTRNFKRSMHFPKKRHVAVFSKILSVPKKRGIRLLRINQN